MSNATVLVSYAHRDFLASVIRNVGGRLGIALAADAYAKETDDEKAKKFLAIEGTLRFTYAFEIAEAARVHTELEASANASWDAVKATNPAMGVRTAIFSQANEARQALREATERSERFEARIAEFTLEEKRIAERQARRAQKSA